MLPNAWDVASARAVVAAGFPVVATTSAGVAAVLGYEDHEGAPGEEMLGAAARIASSVDVPVTVDAEAGYGLEPAELAGELERIGAAGCNLEDTDHATGELRAAGAHAEWLRALRETASELVINARVDVFLLQAGDLADALERAQVYFEAGADCVYPIGLVDSSAIGEFVAQAEGPVNILASPQAPPLGELAELGVARVSYGSLLYRQTMEQFTNLLTVMPR